jgi:glyoxylase-like metal-dependent hydrolase (beta-lactamase superfamily II)
VREPYGASSVLGRSTIEPVANRVWVVRGGMDYATMGLELIRAQKPRRAMNVYLIKEHDGVTMFDAGVEAMSEDLLTIADRMGGLNRVVLGHAHFDHRGAAPHMDAPVLCHATRAPRPRARPSRPTLTTRRSRTACRAPRSRICSKLGTAGR